MKKLFVSLFILCAVLLSGTYFVGDKAENEVQKIFAENKLPGETIKLLSYDRQFFKAKAISEVTLTAEGAMPITFTVTSTILHYPYKAVINNKIRLSDQKLSDQARAYFGSEDWISSTEEISLSGQLIGKLQLLSGQHDGINEQFASKQLDLDYQVDLKDYSGKFSISWEGLRMHTNNMDARLDALQFSADFSYLPTFNEYDYIAAIAKVVIVQGKERTELQGIELQGNSHIGEKENTLDTSNEWQVETYLVDNGEENVFTDNYLQLDLKGLYSPALVLLHGVAGDPQAVAKGLSELVAHGGELSLKKFTSQTPWGEVSSGVDLVLQEGSNLSEIIDNPFALLDYTSGSANLLLPESLLKLPALSNYLQIGLQSGLLEREAQVLTLQTQLERGELTVNGRVIPM